MSHVKTRTQQQKVVIAGAGIAGSACALRLLVMGYRVSILAMEKRPYNFVESVPESALKLLFDLGLRGCLDEIGATRVAGFRRLNGELEKSNQREIWYWHYDRERLAGILLREAVKRGAQVLSVRRVGQIVSERETLFIDATGRAGIWSRPFIRWNKDVADLYELTAAERPGPAQYLPLKGAWAYSITSCERTAVGIVGPHQRARREVEHEVLERFGLNKCTSAFLCRVPAFPQRNYEPIIKDRLAIGDAAVAFSPISGHGVSFALGSAHGAAAVVNTKERCPEWAEVAEQYYREMCENAWESHINSLRRLGTEMMPEVVTLPDALKFSAKIVVVGVLKDGLIRPERAYKGRKGKAVRWLGDFDLKGLEEMARDWVPTRSLMNELPVLQAEAIVARCLKDGLLAGR